jgi:hypothetical protein
MLEIPSSSSMPLLFPRRVQAVVLVYESGLVEPGASEP